MNQLILNQCFISIGIKYLTLREKCPYSGSFWCVFSRIRLNEYGEILCIFPYSVKTRNNTDQKNSEYGHSQVNFSKIVGQLNFTNCTSNFWHLSQFLWHLRNLNRFVSYSWHLNSVYQLRDIWAEYLTRIIWDVSVIPICKVSANVYDIWELWEMPIAFEVWKNACYILTLRKWLSYCYSY